MASSTAAAAVKQPDVGLGASMSMQPVPMEVGGGSVPPQPVQMDLKALLEAHILEHPLESAFHG